MGWKTYALCLGISILLSFLGCCGITDYSIFLVCALRHLKKFIVQELFNITKGTLLRWDFIFYKYIVPYSFAKATAHSYGTIILKNGIIWIKPGLILIRISLIWQITIFEPLF